MYSDYIIETLLKCSDLYLGTPDLLQSNSEAGNWWFVIYLFIWGFMSLSTLYRSYHDG